MKTIIIIDDSTSMLSLMHAMFVKLGYKCICFRCPLEAIEVIPSIFCDLIICDYMMFDMDGLEVIDNLRAKNVKVPMVLYTSLCDKDTRELCDEHDIEFVKKPLTADDLQRLCETHF